MTEGTTGTMGPLLRYWLNRPVSFAFLAPQKHPQSSAQLTERMLWILPDLGEFRIRHQSTIAWRALSIILHPHANLDVYIGVQILL